MAILPSPVGTLTFVPEDIDDDEAAQANGGRVFSAFGVASAALAVLCVAAIVLTSLIWWSHRDERNELEHRTRVLQAAVDWAGVLINLNKDNIAGSLQQLHDGTVGELNTELEKAIAPYTSLVKTLQAKTTGQINSAAIESVFRDPDREPGTPPPADTMPPGLATRTDIVLVVATSVSENPGAPPQTVDWNLRIGVSDVDGRLLVSQLDFLR